MSLTQWFTRSAPIVSCRPVMNATFSFVPTPSALDTSTGSRQSTAIQTEQAAERSDLRQDAGRERGARQRFDSPHGLVAGVDVDAGLSIVHQKSSFPIRVCISCRVARTFRRFPVVRRTSAKKRSLSKSSSSMSKPSASSAMASFCAGPAFEH